ncbi:hypothetical protein SEA_BLESSICA_126 [Mycobacterium phage Blessica]|nr:hypothetical protein SEA_BLESSICA_126 [Mycobacterium phage Blessica]
MDRPARCSVSEHTRRIGASASDWPGPQPRIGLAAAHRTGGARRPHRTGGRPSDWRGQEAASDWRGRIGLAAAHRTYARVAHRTYARVAHRARGRIGPTRAWRIGPGGAHAHSDPAARLFGFRTPPRALRCPCLRPLPCPFCAFAVRVRAAGSDVRVCVPL